MTPNQELVARINSVNPSWSGLRAVTAYVEEDVDGFTIVAKFTEFDDPEVTTIAGFPAADVESATSQFLKEFSRMLHDCRNLTEPGPFDLDIRLTPEQLKEEMEALGWDNQLGVMKWNPSRRN